ncbi:MAG: hypothetical protein GX564_02195, partial [Oligosphaeraceae bacterium]|nr:hypothetical protein [Oligosphaeraceae bacterium]
MPLFGRRNSKDDDLEKTLDTSLGLPEDQRENLELDVMLLEDEDGSLSQRLKKVAEREAVSAAEDSLKKMHVIKMGRCP